MKYKLVIFDFDGTLADSFPWLSSVMNTVADKYRFRRIEHSEIDKVRGFDANSLLKFLRIPFWKMPFIAHYIRRLMNENIGQIPLFKGTDELVRRLAGNGAVLAIVSSNSYENVRQVLGAEIAALVTYYECGVSILGKKTRLKKVLRKSGIAPAETILIGDEIRDIEAAKSAGIASGAVLWGYSRPESLQAHSPDELFTTVDQMAEILAR